MAGMKCLISITVSYTNHWRPILLLLTPWTVWRESEWIFNCCHPSRLPVCNPRSAAHFMIFPPSFHATNAASSTFHVAFVVMVMPCLSGMYSRLASNRGDDVAGIPGSSFVDLRPETVILIVPRKGFALGSSSCTHDLSSKLP